MADEVEAWRLFAPDQEQPKVTVADAVTGEPVDALQVKAPASLFRSEAGRTALPCKAMPAPYSAS